MTSGGAPATALPPVTTCVVEVLREGIVESRHRISTIVLDAQGLRLHAAGEHDAAVVARSVLKPLQALAMVGHGLELPAELLALAASSHSGGPEHIRLVRRLLSRFAISEAELCCAPAPPLADQLCGRAGRAEPVVSSCSGKHAAMLATCVVNGWSRGDYVEPSHPLQVAIRETVEELCGERVSSGVVDGCGAPTFGLSLYGLARAFTRMVVDTSVAAAAVAGAMRAYPLVVGGPGRFVSEAMSAVPGLLVKDGAEGVVAAALPGGTSLAFKVADGAYRAAGPVLGDLLARLGVPVPGLEVPVRGGQREVGRLVVRHEAGPMPPAGSSTTTPDTPPGTSEGSVA